MKKSQACALILSALTTSGAYASAIIDISGSFDWSTFSVTQGGTDMSLLSSNLNGSHAHSFYDTYDGVSDYEYGDQTDPWRNTEAVTNIPDGSALGSAEASAATSSESMDFSASGHNDFSSVSNGALRVTGSTLRYPIYDLPTQDANGSEILIQVDYALSGSAFTDISGDLIYLQNTFVELRASIYRYDFTTRDSVWIDAGRMRYSPGATVRDGDDFMFDGSGTLELSIDPSSFDDWGYRLYVYVEGRAAADTFTTEASEEQPPTIPEPTTLALMGLGIAGIGFARKRKPA